MATPLYLGAAVLAATGVFFLALWLIPILLEIQTPDETNSPIPTPTTNTTSPTAPPAPTAVATKQLRLDTVKVALTVVAGVRGLVALVVAYSRNRRHEHENYRAELEHRRAEAAEDRENTKLFNERFGAASAQLGHEKAAVRLAGVYALAGLADDWEKHDFTGAIFDRGDFTDVEFTGGQVSFNGAEFTAATSTSSAPSSPAARSPSTAPPSPAARSPSPAPSSPAARSPSLALSSLAVRSCSRQ